MKIREGEGEEEEEGSSLQLFNSEVLILQAGEIQESLFQPLVERDCASSEDNVLSRPPLFLEGEREKGREEGKEEGRWGVREREIILRCGRI